MAEVLLLHHIQGLTKGVDALAERIRAAGHVVHTPDVYDGQTFETMEGGAGHAQEIGFDEVRKRGVEAAEGLPAEVFYVGLSMGGMAVQDLAQNRPGARGAVLLASAIPPSEFGSSWPATVPVQFHATEQDPFFVGEGDIEAAQAILEQADDGELFLYPGDQHLFFDSSLPSYDEAATDQMLQRVLALLER
jgi:dienelactone hydrolase